jgi:cell division protein FtsW (lipid II flippase)
MVLAMLSGHAQQLSKGRDFKDRDTWQVFSLILFGTTWMYAVHWLISWGNVLGLLPVMGQPMTWISAANSHLLFFALPALSLSLILAWLIANEHHPRYAD